MQEKKEERATEVVYLWTVSRDVIAFIGYQMGAGTEREIYPGPDGKDIAVYLFARRHLDELKRKRWQLGDAFFYRGYVLKKEGRLARSKQFEVPLTPHGEAKHAEAKARHDSERGRNVGQKPTIGHPVRREPARGSTAE